MLPKLREMYEFGKAYLEEPEKEQVGTNDIESKGRNTIVYYMEGTSCKGSDEPPILFLFHNNFDLVGDCFIPILDNDSQYSTDYTEEEDEFIAKRDVEPPPIYLFACLLDLFHLDLNVIYIDKQSMIEKSIRLQTCLSTFTQFNGENSRCSSQIGKLKTSLDSRVTQYKPKHVSRKEGKSKSLLESKSS